MNFLYHVFGRAFADRRVTKCGGLNLYVAPRGTGEDYTRAKVNTLEGPTSIAHNAYWRNTFKDVLAPQAYRIINDLQSVAKSNMCMMDPVMVGACTDALKVNEKRKICSTAIVTTGSRRDGYGFYSSIHKDDHDRLSMQSGRSLLKHLLQLILPLPFQKKRDYIGVWLKRFGCLSVPTTCSY